jgi:hypothetical protein
VFVQCPEESGTILDWTAFSYTTYLFNNCKNPADQPAPPGSNSIMLRQVGCVVVVNVPNELVLFPAEHVSQPIVQPLVSS